jgi:hypothetical protein
MLPLLGDVRYRRSGPIAVLPPSEASLQGMMKAFNEKLLLLLGVLEAKDGEALLPEGAPKNREVQFGVELVTGLSIRARDMVRTSSRLFGEV